MTDRTPDALLLITRRRWHWARRWHWEITNLWAARWPDGEGYARTFEEARSAGRNRARLGPGAYLPETPDPGIPEAWPTVNLVPLHNPGGPFPRPPSPRRSEKSG